MYQPTYQPYYGAPRRAREPGRMTGASPGLAPSLGRPSPGLGFEHRGFGGDLRDYRDFREADFNAIPGACPPREIDFRVLRQRENPLPDFRSPAPANPWGLRQRENPLLTQDLYSEPFQGREQRYDLYSHDRGDTFEREMYSDPSRGFGRPQRSDPPQAFGARAWEEKSRPRDFLFEPPRPTEERHYYGLRPPEGLHVPGMPRHHFPETYLDSFVKDARGALGREQQSHMPPIPPVPQELRETMERHPAKPEQRTTGPDAAKVPDLPEVIPLGDGLVSDQSPKEQQSVDEASSTAMSELRDCEAQLEEATRQLQRTQLALVGAQVSPGQARADLAQLEARLDRLQCRGIDSVSTAGLSSQDEDAARSLRKHLTREVEQLQSRLDDTFNQLKGR
ncbi:unnamed protein product [Durusdinium trenchii]|uniref:Uncharacterized protein n=2 Tax=Durusdinium trenchii TaxID=1381693 RepID=A0ABP0JXZ6_9DINO